MQHYLPPMPDDATIAALPWWAAGGAALCLAGWLIAWLAERMAERNMRFGEPDAWNPPAVEIPGAAPPGKDRDWTSVRSAFWLALVGALGGTVMGWQIAGSPDGWSGFELVTAAFGVLSAVVVLTRLMRSGPAVGEAPPDDPDKTVAAQLPAALGQVGFAMLMLAAAWLTLR